MRRGRCKLVPTAWLVFVAMQAEHFGGPAPAAAGVPLRDLLSGVSTILSIFESRGFCTTVISMRLLV